MKPASAPSYDLFKIIGAVIPALILILVLLPGCATNAAVPAPTEIIAAANATETLASSPIFTETALVAEAAQTPSPSPSPAAIKPTAAPISATPKTKSAAATEAPAKATKQVASTQAQNESCETILPSRLKVGQTARVVRRLNMRNAASLDAAILQTNPINTRVEIIGGPVCVHMGARAYLWWQIRLATGAEGWSTEFPPKVDTYYLEPVP